MSGPIDEQRLAEIKTRRSEALKVSALADWQLAEYELVKQVLTDSAALLAEVSRLQAERHSTNEALSDAAEQLRVQRDRIAELEALTPAPIQTCQTCGAGYTYGEDCSNCVFQAHMIAAQLARQQEDPHDGPNHHDYALGRDLPFIPQQVTGRCPKGHTFEDCTCGGGS